MKENVIRISKPELDSYIEKLRSIFDIVRLVNVSTTKVLEYAADGTVLESASDCFNVWDKTSRCENCISTRAFSTKQQVSKFEFIHDNIFFVIANYIEVDGVAHVLEVVHQVESESTLVGAFGQNAFVDTITNHNANLYVDSLTKARNRKYYDEQLLGLTCQGAAMIDVDHFKEVNDTFGHSGGDHALAKIVACIKSCVRDKDVVVRYGGDEFVLCFENIPEEIFKQRLEQIRRKVETFESTEYPEMKLSVSIGGAFGEAPASVMIKSADEMVYKAKQHRNKVEVGECK